MSTPFHCRIRAPYVLPCLWQPVGPWVSMGPLFVCLGYWQVGEAGLAPSRSDHLQPSFPLPWQHKRGEYASTQSGMRASVSPFLPPSPNSGNDSPGAPPTWVRRRERELLHKHCTALQGSFLILPAHPSWRGNLCAEVSQHFPNSAPWSSGPTSSSKNKGPRG